MNETRYSYAVARIRSNELSLLNNADMQQILTARTYDDAVRMLLDKGWGDSSEKASYENMFKDELLKTWNFLLEIMPEEGILDALIIKNDFHNLKASLKCCLKNLDASVYFLYPCVSDPAETDELIRKKEFDKLPERMREVAAECYDILIRTADGQYADVVIDRRTIEEIRKLAVRSGVDMLIRYADLIAVTSNIKTGMRCIKTGKDRSFVELAIAGMDNIDRDGFISAVLSGEEKLFELLQHTKYAQAVEALKKSPSAFEKWCDDEVIDCISFARHKPFGAEPLAAFYLAREAEMKTVRVILSGKLNGISQDVITERVRKLYV